MNLTTTQTRNYSTIVFFEALSILRGRNLKSHFYISTVKLTFYSNQSRKRSFSKTALQTWRIWKRRSFVLLDAKHFAAFWNGTFRKTMTSRFIIWFPCSSVSQTRIQNNRRFLLFQISMAQCRLNYKTYDALSEWKSRFQITRHEAQSTWTNPGKNPFTSEGVL